MVRVHVNTKESRSFVCFNQRAYDTRPCETGLESQWYHPSGPRLATNMYQNTEPRIAGSSKQRRPATQVGEESDGGEAFGSPARFVRTECLREFATKQGLDVHMTSRHPDEANRQIDVNRTKARCSRETTHLMATEEARATLDGVKLLNRHLERVIQGRTLEAIKRRRRCPDYKNLVITSINALVAARTELLGASDGSPAASPRRTEAIDENGPLGNNA